LVSIEPDELITPGQAQRLADARKAGGHDVGELAALLGISYEAYHDLEHFDEEIVDTVSLDQLIQLASALGLDLRSFFAAKGIGHVSFAELAERLQRLLDNGDMTLAELEDEVGWELQRHLADPTTFSDLPAIALADIGQPVGLDWRSFLPPRE
jgi:hypothetical protein